MELCVELIRSMGGGLMVLFVSMILWSTGGGGLACRSPEIELRMEDIIEDIAQVFFAVGICVDGCARASILECCFSDPYV